MVLSQALVPRWKALSPVWSVATRGLSADAQRVAAEDGPFAPPPTGGKASQQQQGSHRPLAGSTQLQRYGRDLTADAAAGRLDPVLGREDVTQRTLQVLLRRTKNNPVLIGDAGVGKTAVAEGVAQLMASPAAPPGLAGRRLVSLDVGSLVAGTQYRGAFEERLQGVLSEVRAAGGRVVLFIDELHLLMGAGRVEGGVTAANLLKPALARGELHCIGATTVEEYRKHIEQDAAFARRFQPVLVEEPSAEQALEWLQGLVPRYERHHGVRFTPAALEAAVRAAQRYSPDRRLPDSAIDLVDEAAARARLQAARDAVAAGAAAPEALAGSAAAAQEAEQQWRWWVESTAAGRSPEEARRLLEWFGAVAHQPQQLGFGVHQETAAARQRVFQEQLGQGVLATGSAASQPALEQQQRQAMPQVLPCPHCGTPTPSVHGAVTVSCPRCRFTFLNVPPEKLLLGASLFLQKHQPAAAGGSSTPQAAAPPAAHETVSAAAAAAVGDAALVVDAADVLLVAAEAAGVSADALSQQAGWRQLLALEGELAQRVAGQAAAVRAVAGAVRLGRLGLQRGRRVLASLVVAGPPGVGRATLCHALASSLLGDPERTLLRFDMAEYAERASVSRLIGAPPGYVGYGDGGALTEAVRRRPHSVVVFQRVERAHPEVLQLLSQVLETGQLQDSMGRRCDFRNAVVVLAPSASVAGAAGAVRSDTPPSSCSVGGGDMAPVPQGHVHEPAGGADSSSGDSSFAAAHAAAAMALGPEPAAQQPQQAQRPAAPVDPLRRLPPELLSLADAVVQLQPLTRAAMEQVVALQLAECEQALTEQGAALRVEGPAASWLAQHGLSRTVGARRLQALLREQLLAPAAEALLRLRMQQAEEGGGSEERPACTLVLSRGGDNGLLLSMEE